MVGIDAGIKTGYAILSLNGKLIAIGCEKEANGEKIVKKITEYGKPVLIASDTKPASHFVSKIAAILNTKLYVPKESLKKNEKRNIGRGIVDPHIRDSFAAAIKAYRKYSNRLRQIDSMNVNEKDKLKMMVISGMRISEEICYSMHKKKPNI